MRVEGLMEWRIMWQITRKYLGGAIAQRPDRFKRSGRLRAVSYNRRSELLRFHFFDVTRVEIQLGRHITVANRWLRFHDGV